MADNTKFWVIFDTATKPDYYQDVHNILALPGGAIIRYEYRLDWLSEAAKRHANDSKSSPVSGLVIFTQLAGRTRENQEAQKLGGNGEPVWTPTRFIRLATPPIRNGDHFVFDLKVLDYPRLDREELMKIINPLLASEETPYHGKWVTVSDKAGAFGELHRGDETENWQQIVSDIGQAQRRFAGDFFWRLRGPFGRNGAQLVLETPRYDSIEEIAAGQSLVRGTRALHELVEGKTLLFEATSYVPRPAVDPRSPTILRVEVEKDGPVLLQASAISREINMRRYTSKTVELRGKRSEEIERREGTAKFSSGPWLSGWPVGPEFELEMSVKKSWWRTALGVGLALAALIPFSVGGDVSNTFIKAILILSAVLVLTGRLSIRGVT